MASNDIFAKITPAQASEIFAFLFEKEKPLYKASIEALATRRNLRPVFIERKPRPERFAWMQEALSRPGSEPTASQLLHIWLVGAKSALLCDFLDALGIAHDATGTVEELPQAPSKEKLLAAIEKLLAKHDPASASLYLHAFQALHENGGWPALSEILASDERLKLGC